MNLDVLEQIVAGLSKPDLAACALVSRSYLAATLPALYRSIEYTAHHAKRDPNVSSPFAALAAHDHLPVHVRHIAVHAAPARNDGSTVVDSRFVAHLVHSLRAATNLHAFVCTVNNLPPALLPILSDRPPLSHLRIAAALGPRQTLLLQAIPALRSLALDSPSWQVLDVLPTWSASIQRTLAHLTLYMSQDLDPATLNATLAHLPRLLGLHIVGCPRVSHSAVLTALSHTPDLRELSLSIFPAPDCFPLFNFPVPPLTHLSIDVRISYPALQPLLAHIISRLSPRYALAIAGAYIGEINASSERVPPQDPASHPHSHPVDLPLLGPAHPHPHPDDNDDHDVDDTPDPPPDTPSLIDALPSALVVLHLPLLTPAALAEIIARCKAIQLLGIFIGTAFTPHLPANPPKSTNRAAARSAARFKHATVNGVRPEITVLANLLSRATALRELIIDTTNTDIVAHANSADLHGAFRGVALLSPIAVRMLMRESPFLRRIVGEGRIWQSPTPTPSSPLPFPHRLDIDLNISKLRHGPGVINHHGYAPLGSGAPGGAFTQVEVVNDHWFWLSGSASAGRVHSRF